MKYNERLKKFHPTTLRMDECDKKILPPIGSYWQDTRYPYVVIHIVKHDYTDFHRNGVMVIKIYNLYHHRKGYEFMDVLAHFYTFILSDEV